MGRRAVASSDGELLAPAALPVLHPDRGSTWRARVDPACRSEGEPEGDATARRPIRSRRYVFGIAAATGCMMPAISSIALASAAWTAAF